MKRAAIRHFVAAWLLFIAFWFYLYIFIEAWQFIATDIVNEGGVFTTIFIPSVTDFLLLLPMIIILILLLAAVILLVFHARQLLRNDTPTVRQAVLAPSAILAACVTTLFMPPQGISVSFFLCYRSDVVQGLKSILALMPFIGLPGILLCLIALLLLVPNIRLLRRQLRKTQEGTPSSDL